VNGKQTVYKFSFLKAVDFPASRRIPLPQPELITKPAPLHDDNHKFVINAG
jgi:hypothetical protein